MTVADRWVSRWSCSRTPGQRAPPPPPRSRAPPPRPEGVWGHEVVPLASNPSRPREVRARPVGLVQRRIVEGLHEAPQTHVLFDAERVDGREVVQHEPVVPHVRISNVVPDAELAPAPVDVDEVAERAEGAVVVEDPRPPELLILQPGRRSQDPVVRPRVEPDEGEQALSIHPTILGGGPDVSSPGTSGPCSPCGVEARPVVAASARSRTPTASASAFRTTTRA